MQRRFEEAAAVGLGGGELRFEPVAQGHQFIHLDDDALLFGEGREGKRTAAQLSHLDDARFVVCFEASSKYDRPSGLLAKSAIQLGSSSSLLADRMR